MKSFKNFVIIFLLSNSLVNALGKYYSIAFNRNINSLNEVLITVGGYGSLFNAFSGLLQKDDEVFLFILLSNRT